MDIQEIRSVFNKTASSFNRRGWLLEFLLFNNYRKRLVSQAKGRVLEVAIGTGRNFPYYPIGCEIIGIDLSEKMLEIARSSSINPGLSVTLFMMDAENLAFKDCTFDTVLCTISLCIVPDPIKALSEMKRVCKSGGRILLLEHVRSHNHLLGKIQDWLTPINVRRFGCHLNRDTVRNVKETGLNIDYLESYIVGTFKIIHSLISK